MENMGVIFSPLSLPPATVCFFQLHLNFEISLFQNSIDQSIVNRYPFYVVLSLLVRATGIPATDPFGLASSTSKSFITWLEHRMHTIRQIEQTTCQRHAHASFSLYTVHGCRCRASCIKMQLT